jgi:hypothetical protein
MWKGSNLQYQTLGPPKYSLVMNGYNTTTQALTGELPHCSLIDALMNVDISSLSDLDGDPEVETSTTITLAEEDKLYAFDI